MQNLSAMKKGLCITTACHTLVPPAPLQFTRKRVCATKLLLMRRQFRNIDKGVTLGCKQGDLWLLHFALYARMSLEGML